MYNHNNSDDLWSCAALAAIRRNPADDLVPPSLPQGTELHPGINLYAGGFVQVVDEAPPAPPIVQEFERAYHGASLPGETAAEASRRIGAEVMIKIGRDFAGRETPPLVTVNLYERNGGYDLWFTVGEWKF